MRKYQMTLDDTLVLRGISILIIILHNYIHWFSNVVLENQHVYYPERNKELIDSFLEFDSGLFLDLISHYGHYGVPVFIFQSGYGVWS
jgi:peptidoglycan/LPS O-acetylase OafA/YrhL